MHTNIPIKVRGHSARLLRVVDGYCFIRFENINVTAWVPKSDCKRYIELYKVRLL